MHELANQIRFNIDFAYFWPGMVSVPFLQEYPDIQLCDLIMFYYCSHQLGHLLMCHNTLTLLVCSPSLKPEREWCDKHLVKIVAVLSVFWNCLSWI